MSIIRELIQECGTVLLDGAMGTMLFARGLTAGAPPEEWNVTHPDMVREVHRAYIEAGSNIILTNSFGGTRYRLKLHNYQDRVAEFNEAAARNARLEADLAPRRVLVAGSIGPSGELLQPMGNMVFEEAKAAFAEQAAALASGGVDVLWIETMSDLNEVIAAIEGARSVCDLPVIATMTFDTNGRTMMGVTPEQAVDVLSKYDLAALGGNCGNGPGEIEGVIGKMHALRLDIPLVAKSNAGIPKWQNDELIYDGTPDVMHEHVRRVRGLGATLVGGCCGNGPEHIAAMAKAIQLPPLVLDVVQQEGAMEPAAHGKTRERRFRR